MREFTFLNDLQSYNTSSVVIRVRCLHVYEFIKYGQTNVISLKYVFRNQMVCMSLLRLLVLFFRNLSKTKITHCLFFYAGNNDSRHGSKKFLEYFHLSSLSCPIVSRIICKKKNFSRYGYCSLSIVVHMYEIILFQ